MFDTGVLLLLIGTGLAIRFYAGTLLALVFTIAAIANASFVVGLGLLFGPRKHIR